MIDDDEPIQLTGFIPVGDQDREITQGELDRAAAFTGPVLHIFRRIPDDLVIGVVISVMTTFCLRFDDPAAAVDYLAEQAQQALPKLRASQTATRQ